MEQLAGTHEDTFLDTLRSRPAAPAVHDVRVVECVMRVGVIGLGHVGRNVRSRLVGLGVDVVAHDRADGGVYPRAELAACDFSVVCVGTPSLEDGSADLGDVLAAVEALPTPRVMLRSTVPPGTTSALVEKTGKQICFSPEYVGETAFSKLRWEAWAQDELFWILGGESTTTRWFAARIAEIHGAEPRVHQTTSTEAEIVKYMENSYFAVKVTFVNEFYEFCERAGADWFTVREAWLADPRVERDHTAVMPRNRGYAGRCLPKDVDALLAAADVLDLPMPLLTATREANMRYRSRSHDDD